MGYERNDIFLSKPPKAAFEKIAKKKGIFVAEPVRRIIRNSTVGRNKKGESLVAVAGAGCGRTPHRSSCGGCFPWIKQSLRNTRTELEEGGSEDFETGQSHRQYQKG